MNEITQAESGARFKHVLAFEVSKATLVTKVLPSGKETTNANTAANIYSRLPSKRSAMPTSNSALVRYFSSLNPQAATTGTSAMRRTTRALPAIGRTARACVLARGIPRTPRQNRPHRRTPRRRFRTRHTRPGAASKTHCRTSGNCVLSSRGGPSLTRRVAPGAPISNTAEQGRRGLEEPADRIPREEHRRGRSEARAPRRRDGAGSKPTQSRCALSSASASSARAPILAYVPEAVGAIGTRDGRSPHRPRALDEFQRAEAREPSVVRRRPV